MRRNHIKIIFYLFLHIFGCVILEYVSGPIKKPICTSHRKHIIYVGRYYEYIKLKLIHKFWLSILSTR